MSDIKIDMLKPFRYMGGKIQLTKTLLRALPKHDRYVELFTGGGTLFWAKKKASIGVLNDTSDIVYKTYKAIKYTPLELEKEIRGLLPCKAMYVEIMDGTLKPRNELEEVAFWLYTGFYSIFGTRAPKSFDDNLRKNSFLRRSYVKYAKKLEDVVISKRDYKAILSDCKDDTNSFFYLDPPYLDTFNAYDCKDVDINFFKEMKESLKEIKGKFLLSHIKHESIREIFKDFEIVEVDTIYQLGKSAKDNDGSALKKKEYLIANYDIKNLLNDDKLGLFS